MEMFITTYYKGLYGKTETNTFTLYKSVANDIPQVNYAEKHSLLSTFTVEELKMAIFTLYKAPGPYGFPTEFYRII